MDPASAANEFDREARQRRLVQVRGEIRQFDQAVAANHGLPGFLPQDEGHPALGLHISVEDLERLAEKLTRATTWKQAKLLITDKYSIEVFFDPGQGQAFAAILEKWGKRLYRGPGFLIERAVPQEDEVASINSYLIWGSLRFWSAVRPRELVLSMQSDRR